MRAGAPRLRHLANGLSLVLLLAFLQPGREIEAADESHERIERRLKSVGVSADLARRITKAVERGAVYLLRTQQDDGSWPIPTGFEGMRAAGARGVTALCALALQHSETQRAGPFVNKALGFVLARGGRGYGRTYVDGIAAMLAFSLPEYRAALGGVADRLAAAQDPETSWWGYAARSKTPNLSTTQFALLGLWACARSGCTVPASIWSLHVHALMNYQTSSGSWPYWPKSGGPAYTTGTFIGHANLLLTQAALAGGLKTDRKLSKQVQDAVHRSSKALVRDGVRVLRAPAKASNFPDVWLSRQPWASYYRLYALEKACIFAGTERLGKHPWYVKGAEFLLKVQRKDGSWGAVPKRWRGSKVKLAESGDSISTAFALLFLLRSSEVYRPATPRPLGKLPAPVTGGSSK